MLKTKSVQIDGQLYETPATATVADIVPWNVQSITTPAGALIPREQFARMPVPDGFDTNLSIINKGDGIEAPYLPGWRHQGKAALARFAASAVWRWTVVTGKFAGLTTLTAAATAAAVVGGRLLLLNDHHLRSALYLNSNDNGPSDAPFLLAIVVTGTAIVVMATGGMKRLWRQTFALLPFVQCALARIKYSLELFGSIAVASISAMVVWALFPALLHGDWEVAPAFGMGLFFLSLVIYSLVSWIRRLRARA